jgi:hypothetical protein
MDGSKLRLGILLGIVAAVCLAVAGCQTAYSTAGPAVGALSAGWRKAAAEAINREFPSVEAKIMFLGEPKAASVRYRYWTNENIVGHAGLAALKARRPGGLLGPSGPWLVLYVLGPGGEPILVTENLEAADVDPPVYALEVVDQTKSVEHRLPRPLGLGREGLRRLGEFTKIPWEELPAYQ